MRLPIKQEDFPVCDKTGCGKNGLSGGNAVKVPIIGMGGICSAEDAMEFILAGATAVSVGTANFHNPYTTVEVAAGIEDYMRRHQVEDIKELIGIVK